MSSAAFTKFKVGFATLVALVVLFGGTLWVKNYNPATNKMRMEVEFVNGGGITWGDPVHMSGIKIGEVTGVSLSGNHTALIRFYADYIKLSPDTEFIIEDVGLMGDRALVIVPGKMDGEIDQKKIHRGSERTGFSDLMTTAGNLIERLNSIGEKLDNDLDFAGLSERFEQTFQKLSEAVDTYRNVMVENREPLKRTLRNLDEAATGMKNFIDTNDDRLSMAIDSFQKASEQVTVLLKGTENLAVIIDTLAVHMQAGNGTLARLIKQDDLYEELRQTNAHIDSFIIDFKTNPGKYTKDMKFKVRLF